MRWNSFRKTWKTVDNLHHRRTFDPENENEIPGKKPFESGKIPKFG